MEEENKMGIGGEKSTKEIIFHATDIAEGKKHRRYRKRISIRLLLKIRARR